MNRLEIFNKVNNQLLALGLELRTVQFHLFQIDKEIATLVSVEANLEENISVLKRKRSIVVASEYDKAKTDLRTARIRLMSLRQDQFKYLKIQEKMKNKYTEIKEQYDIALENFRNPPSNIIQFPGRRDGR